MLGQLAVAAPVSAAANELGFFDCGDEYAVFQDGGGGVTEESADARMIMLDYGLFLTWGQLGGLQTRRRMQSCPTLAFFDFGPGVAQRGGAVEDQAFGLRIQVDTEIAEALELVTGAGAASRRLGSSLQPRTTSSEFGLRLAVKSWPSAPRRVLARNRLS